MSFATLRVIFAAITLVSGVFFLESRSDTVRWGNHNTVQPSSDWYFPPSLLGCHVFTEGKGWTVLLLQMKNKWTWMENCRGMERDHYFCGTMSTTRSHTRNQDPPQWKERFVSMAAHFSAVNVAIIMEIGQLKMLQLIPLTNAAIHNAMNSPLPVISSFFYFI